MCLSCTTANFFGTNDCNETGARTTSYRRRNQRFDKHLLEGAESSDELNLLIWEPGTMKRATSTLAAVAAGSLLLTAPALASEEVSASRILSSIYASLGMDNQPAEIEKSRNGVFFGVHTAVGPDSGILPVASGLSSPLLLDRGFEDSITANGYYVYQTNFSLGTYVGGGFGRFNLVDNALINPAAQRGNYGVQGMAGLTFAFSPSMVLGLEYRYAETMPGNSFATTTTPGAQQDESVTLRFDFLLN